METILPLLILISLCVIGIMAWLFFRMSNGGQFDDMEAPARRILMDDDGPAKPAQKNLSETKSD